MKFYKLFFILMVFFKTGNVLSDSNIFDVNNIEVEKIDKASNEVLANQAIKKGFKELISRILLREDTQKLNDLKLSEIKELVTYYQVSNKENKISTKEKTIFNISFDKNKIHALFFKKNIAYSDIGNKEIFILPILKKNNQIYTYNQNFFYNNWNKVYDTKLIEFILPLESIEIIQEINKNNKNLFNIKLDNLFREYTSKNLAIVLIEDNNSQEEKIYFKIKILDKIIIKNIKLKRSNFKKEEFNKKIITEIKKEIINLIKSQNLIDVRVPSFLNAQLKVNNKNNLVVLNSRIQKIDLIEKIYIQEFNNQLVFMKIKYLGKLDKIINELKKQKVFLNLVGDQWSIRII